MAAATDVELFFSGVSYNTNFKLKEHSDWQRDMCVDIKWNIYFETFSILRNSPVINY